MTALVVAALIVMVVTGADALLGAHLILIGLLVAGPAVAAVSVRPWPTATMSAVCVVLAVALGAPDRIWFTGEHFVWIAAVAVVGLANTAVVAVVAARAQVSADSGAQTVTRPR